MCAATVDSAVPRPQSRAQTSTGKSLGNNEKSSTKRCRKDIKIRECQNSSNEELLLSSDWEATSELPREAHPSQPHLPTWMELR